MKKLLPLLALLLLLFSCGKKMQLAVSDIKTNSAAAMNAPYVILISLDGFRWDYVERFQPPNLSKFITEGVQAESLIPCFPSKTFPNHYSIATGMYPENHGLVDNSFYNPEKNAVYRIRDREKVRDGTWYDGTPLWVLAEESGMVSASYFFVGTDADIQGIFPTYYFPYDGSVPNETRVKKVLSWLDMPAVERPHFIATYFSDMDNIGHAVGPNADEKLKEKLMLLDSVLGELFDEVKNTGLPVNIIIVSDHGMYEIPVNQLIAIESIENEDLYQVVNNGAIVHVYLNKGTDISEAINYLKPKEKHFTVYRTDETPQFDIPAKNPNWGQLQVIPDNGWYFKTQRSLGIMQTSGKEFIGEHGLSPDNREIHGIFYANGPAFKNSHTIPSVKNIHIYPVICKILGLEMPKEVDGKLEVLEKVLR